MSHGKVMPCSRSLQDTRSRHVFHYVVTPDSIPQFVIPSLESHKKPRRFIEEKRQPEERAWRSSSDTIVERALSQPGSVLSCSDAELAATVEAIADPVTRAALSLPHLPKIATPYGFVSLGESPQVTSEEALFFHSGFSYPLCPAARIRSASQEKPASCRHPELPIAGGDGCSQMGGDLRDCKQTGPHAISHQDGKGSHEPRGIPMPRRHARPLSNIQIIDVVESKEAEKTERKQKTQFLEVACQRSSSSLELPAGKPRKNLLPKILKRHFTHFRQLKPTDFTFH
ncbi:PREDICTED: C2 calcium-dependent domain-containing protein 4C-like [Tinamus guttatus]|uniref:C2 calcium-dependent domain-containing protein 4C-like n=1 Tax=Tinamus guttatus TaxID=94827 RepID=UPI00052E7B32|nr:PREDICTED: C2 calcium-dependent domain-containing protein 4C-like [Tinamus guttatus]